MFGFFLNTFLWLFDLSLPKIKKTSTIIQNNGWITPTIKVLCCLKRDLYQHTKNYNDPKLKNYYKVRCKILSNMIKETKRSYNRQIVISKNKMKTTWNIIEVVRVRKFVHKNIHILNTDCNLTNNSKLSPVLLMIIFCLQLIELIIKHLKIWTPIEIIASHGISIKNF